MLFGERSPSNKSFLGVAAGAGNNEPLPGPPSVITDSAVPRPGEQGVPVSQIFQALFTEPVTNVSSSSVFLREVDGPTVPLELIGTDPDGVPGPVDSSSIITALTMRPSQGLKFSTSYELVFTGDVVDTDENPPGTPDPQNLTPDPTGIDFSTFSPEKLGEAEASGAFSLAVIGNRAFVGQNTFPASLRAFDLSDPTRPEIIGDTPLVGIFPKVIAEESVDIGTGETDLVAVLTTNTLSGQGILDVFAVGGSETPFPRAAVVTTNQGVQGSYAAGAALLKGFAYVVIGSGGLEVIDLNRAAELLQATSTFEVNKALNTKGQGFGQQAILNTIAIEIAGSTASASAVAVKEGPQGRVAFVGSLGHLSSVDVSGFTPQPILESLPLQIDMPPDPPAAMAFVSRIGLTSVGDIELAVVVGTSAASSRGAMAVVDITDPANPILLSIVELQGTAGRSLAIDTDGTTVFVGTQEGVEIYNLTDPAVPAFAGKLEGLTGEVALAAGLLLSTGEEGIQTVALADIVTIRNITASAVIFDQGNPVTENDITVDFGVIPADVEIVTAEVEIFKDGELLEVLPAQVSGADGVAVWPAGRPIDLKASYFARAVIEPGTQRELRSAPRQVPAVHLVFINKRGEESFAPPLSDPRPVVTLDPASPQDVTLLGDGRTARVRFSGEVTDALADITPNGAADIREVFVGEQSFPVQRIADTDTVFRPFAFRGRFNGTATVKIWDGANPVIVEARNIAGNVGYDSLTVAVTQDVRLPDAVATGNVVHTKFLDPFTFVLAPLSANVPDSVLLAHGTTDPVGTSPLIETADDSLVFVGTNTQLGAASVMLSAPFPANSSTLRDSVEAVVASSFLAITSQSLEFVETDVDSGVFRSTAFKLPNNEVLQVRLQQPLEDSELDVVFVRLGFNAADDGMRIEETGLDTATFVENVPGLGNMTLVVRTLTAAAGVPTTLTVFLSTDELDLESYLMTLLETSSGSLRFLSQAEGPASEVVLPTEPHSTQLVSVEDDQGSNAGMFEPFWPVARGLIALEPTDRGFVDQTRIELSVAPLPFRQGSGAYQRLRCARYALAFRWSSFRVDWKHRRFRFSKRPRIRWYPET